MSGVALKCQSAREAFQRWPEARAGTHTEDRDKKEQGEERMGGEGEVRETESCWESGLENAIVNILHGVPTA